MKRLAVVALLGLLAACSGDDAAGTTTSTTLLYGTGVVGGGGGGSSSSGSSGSGSSDDGSSSGVGSGGSGSVESGYCATGRYELDGADLWAQISDASPEGGSAEVISGSVSLELRDDLTATLSMNAWTFRLYFDGEVDTVLATQNGQMLGTWAVDDGGRHSIGFDSENVTGVFLLETAQGSFPVPSGLQTVVVPIGVPMFARCDVDFVVIPVLDQQLGVTIEWIFDRS